MLQLFQHDNSTYYAKKYDSIICLLQDKCTIPNLKNLHNTLENKTRQMYNTLNSETGNINTQHTITANTGYRTHYYTKYSTQHN